MTMPAALIRHIEVLAAGDTEQGPVYWRSVLAQLRWSARHDTRHPMPERLYNSVPPRAGANTSAARMLDGTLFWSTTYQGYSYWSDVYLQLMGHRCGEWVDRERTPCVPDPPPTPRTTESVKFKVSRRQR